MDIIKNIFGFLMVYMTLPVIAIVAFSGLIMMEKEVKRISLKVAWWLAACATVVYLCGPITAGPHATLTWKRIISTEKISKEDIDSAMEICKESFRNHDGDKYRWLKELSYREDGQYQYISKYNTERITIYPNVKTSFFHDYDIYHISSVYTLERQNGGEWKLISINDMD